VQSDNYSSLAFYFTAHLTAQKLLFKVTPASNLFTRTEPEDIYAQLLLTSFQLSVIKLPGGKAEKRREMQSFQRL